jgi:NTE family protein
MKAYAIFDGGGMKGAAFAGCLKAANEKRITFHGYAGTSVGAIVALLSAVGYTGQELEKLLVDEAAVTDILDQPVGHLQQLRRVFQRLGNREFWTLYRQDKEFIFGLFRDLGLNSGANLQKYLDTKVREKLKASGKTALAAEKTITFKHFADAGLPPLKVLASDILDRQPVIYSAETHPSFSVVEAVRASASYPLLFVPVVMNHRRLVDGGLSANLPISLFETERAADGSAVIAFDLVQAAGNTRGPDYHFFDYLRDMLETALEASEQMLRPLVGGVFRIPIEIPGTYGTLDLDLDTEKRKQLFLLGHSQTHSWLAENVPQLDRARSPIEDIQATHAPFAPVQRVLRAIQRDVEQLSPAENVRVNVMLPTAGKLVIVYHYGMAGHSDLDIQLSIEKGGCAGTAFAMGQPMFADLEKVRLGEAKVEDWNMTNHEQKLVEPNRNALVSFPLFSHQKVPGEGRTRRIPRGVLNVDTSTRLAETQWVSGGPTYQAMLEWTNSLESLLFD